jgi:hypothetical protein
MSDNIVNLLRNKALALEDDEWALAVLLHRGADNIGRLRAENKRLRAAGDALAEWAAEWADRFVVIGDDPHIIAWQEARREQ